MSIFSKKAQPQQTDEDRLVRETAAKLADEKQFWDNIVSWSEPETEAEAERIVRVADRLVKLRRERFPL